jgi:DNA-binding MurR/RpiR family transcriptional regulator
MKIMEELSNTERLIVSYIKSHPPEDCMLDKITRGTSRSRATVLKYLEILHAKEILDFKFVGRSNLYLLLQDYIYYGQRKRNLKSQLIVLRH